MADTNDTTTPAPMAPATRPDLTEIAGITRDIQVLMFGGVLTNTDTTLMTRGASRGLKIYDDLKRDCHAGAVLDKRKLAVQSRAWTVTPASDSRADKKAADLVRNAFKAINFNRICGNLLEAVLKGYAVGEVMWETRDGAWLPRDIKGRAAHRFAMDVDGQPRLRTRENMMQGIVLPDRKFIVHRFGASDDFPYGLGLGNALFWPVLFKRQDITFWLKFVDKFGSPTAVGKYPNAANPLERQTLLSALNAIANDAGIIVPEGMVIELLKPGVTTDNYEALARYMDEQISERVLGETMSTTSSGAGLGSGQANVQNDVRLEVAEADADLLSETLNSTIVKWIVEYNMPGAGVPSVDRVFDEAEDLDKIADRDSKLSTIGWVRTEESMQETYGPGYERKPAAPLPDALASDDPNAPAPPAFSETSALGATNREAQQALLDAATAAADGWKAIVEPRIKRLRAVLDTTGDLVQFRESLNKLLDDPPNDEMVDALAKGAFAAHILGRGKARPSPKPQGIFSRLLNLKSRRQPQ